MVENKMSVTNLTKFFSYKIMIGILKTRQHQVKKKIIKRKLNVCILSQESAAAIIRNYSEETGKSKADASREYLRRRL